MAEEKDPSLITVKEFKMWLQGVEEMQPDGWSPDQRQWAKIRAKIDISLLKHKDWVLKVGCRSCCIKDTLSLG